MHSAHLITSIVPHTARDPMYVMWYITLWLIFPCRDGSNEGHTVVCSAVSPLVSGGGPVSD